MCVDKERGSACEACQIFDTLIGDGEQLDDLGSSGQPQCFLTSEQLFDELAQVGFSPEPAVPFTEYNRPAPDALHGARPVIYEAAFRLTR